ncbi:MAG: AAA family ATPase [Gammaproteobacteria bacterium]|nr:AAA family ATPase [Gammaproteobacteria bacterium]MBU1775612.1 AAA family ATPase [Gammaproteobacteria bacterium]MBU1969733.1 AAA family ATPase [Gammaproteobacteria bacterium]
MYQAFYGLKENPFSIQPDPDYLYFGRRHTYAYATMEFGIKNRAGFMVVSGEIGCGKTTLIRHLLNNLASDHTVGLVYNTHREISNLLEWIMLSLGLPYDGKSNVALFDAFQRFLIEQYGLGKSVLLIIDEAQNLSPDALESLRMLSNINADKDQLLQIMLVGQPQLKDMLMRPELLQFSQRVEVDFHIKPFAAPDVQGYIEHRLAVAGRNSPLFTPDACDKIAEATQGIPRRINILCNTALVYGFSAEAELIDRTLVEEVLSDKAEFGALSNSE